MTSAATATMAGLDLDMPAALATARLGWFNLHFSLLPAWRGAAPVQRAIMARLAETASLDRADLTGLDPEMLDALVIAGRIVLDGSTLTLGHLDDMPPMSPEPCPTRGGPSEFPRALLGCSCLVCFEGLPR